MYEVQYSVGTTVLCIAIILHIYYNMILSCISCIYNYLVVNLEFLQFEQKNPFIFQMVSRGSKYLLSRK